MRYPGSKRRLADKICNYMKYILEKVDFHPRGFYDLMTGGGNMAMAALKCFPGIPVVINDIDRKAAAYFRKLKEEPEDAILTILSRPKTKEDYIQMRDACRKGEVEDWLCFWYSYSLSFGSGLWAGYNPDKQARSTERLLLHLLDDIFLARQVSEIYNHDYTYFSLVSDSIIYLDPPYVSTVQKYEHKWTETDRIQLYKWGLKMSKNNLVFISDGSPPPVPGWRTLFEERLHAPIGNKSKETKFFYDYLHVAEKWITGGKS